MQTVNPMTAIPLQQFARQLSPPVAYQTIRLWVTEGLLNRNTKRRVTQEAVRIPLGLATDNDAYLRFLVRLGEKDSEDSA